MLGETVLIEVPVCVCGYNDDGCGSVDEVLVHGTHAVGCVGGVEEFTVSLAGERAAKFAEYAFAAHDGGAVDPFVVFSWYWPRVLSERLCCR